MSSSSSSHDVQNPSTTIPAAPIYITIGPPCCGKTTLLKELQQRLSNNTVDPILDITIDDQENVYVKVDTIYFLQNSSLTTTKQCNFLKRRMIAGYPLYDRIYNERNDEMRAIVQYFYSNQMKQDQVKLESTIYSIYRQYAIEEEEKKKRRRAKNSETNEHTIDDIPMNHPMMLMANDLINVIMKMGIFPTEQISTTMNVFCVEVLFRNNPKTNRTGVEMAEEQLSNAATQTQRPIAWGNTNTRPRDYKIALEIASKSLRPVYFIANCHREGIIQNGLFLPPLSRDEFIYRNINRLLTTGKYVPTKTLCESQQRVELFLNKMKGMLVKDATKRKQQGEQDVEITKYDFDKLLCKQVNFEMDESRRVKPMGANEGASVPPSLQQRRFRDNNNNNNSDNNRRATTQKRPERQQQPVNGWNQVGNYRGAPPPLTKNQRWRNNET